MSAFAFAICMVGIPRLLGFSLVKIFILILCVWRQAWDGARFERKTALPIVAGLLVLSAATAASISWQTSLFGQFDSWTYGLIPITLCAAVFFMASKNPPSRSALAWLGVALSVHAIAQRLNLDPTISAAQLPSMRAIAGVGSPVHLAAILAMLFFMSDSVWQKAIIAGGLWATQSRAGALAVACGLAVQCAPRNARWIAAASLLFFLIPAREPKDLGRQQVWLSAEDTFRAHPLLGAGPDTIRLTFVGPRLDEYQRVYHKNETQAQAHNDILQVLATTGILGLAAYAWLILSLPAAPALVALFVFMKFDPISIDGLALAAMIAAMEAAA